MTAITYSAAEINSITAAAGLDDQPLPRKGYCTFVMRPFHEMIVITGLGRGRYTISGLAPDTNTEAAQLDADLAEQPAEYLAAIWSEMPKTAADKRAVTVTEYCRLRNIDAQNYPVTVADLADLRTDEIELLNTTRRPTSPATLLDDVQTLPLFSGTAPRVADPGRFDPPQISTDRQPALF